VSKWQLAATSLTNNHDRIEILALSSTCRFPGLACVNLAGCSADQNLVVKSPLIAKRIRTRNIGDFWGASGEQKEAVI
jgi:hypothetical protein